jgi:hypothetical protein
MAKFPLKQIAQTCRSQVTSCKHLDMKRLLGNEYMDYRGNVYADYNRQNVVVNIFYSFLPKSYWRAPWNSGRESQGAQRQDELIGGIPPVVK